MCSVIFLNSFLDLTRKHSAQLYNILNSIFNKLHNTLLLFSQTTYLPFRGHSHSKAPLDIQSERGKRKEQTHDRLKPNVTLLHGFYSGFCARISEI